MDLPEPARTVTAWSSQLLREGARWNWNRPSRINSRTLPWRSENPPLLGVPATICLGSMPLIPINVEQNSRHWSVRAKSLSVVFPRHLFDAFNPRETLFRLHRLRDNEPQSRFPSGLYAFATVCGGCRARIPLRRS
jgi:hypothetical protein